MAVSLSTPLFFLCLYLCQYFDTFFPPRSLLLGTLPGCLRTDCCSWVILSLTGTIPLHKICCFPGERIARNCAERQTALLSEMAWAKRPSSLATSGLHSACMSHEHVHMKTYKNATCSLHLNVGTVKTIQNSIMCLQSISKFLDLSAREQQLACYWSTCGNML